jgi:hypothetical protein
MTRRKPRIIKDKKVRGEWAESIFIARASEHGLAVSKPWGDSSSYDCVVGTPGRFVAVQVKSTTAELVTGKGYNCSVCSSGKPYRAGSFDYLAAYVVPEDAWYIVPAKEIRGMKSISLSTETGRYEKYLEAWHLLREAAGPREEPAETCVQQTAPVEPVRTFPRNAVERMQAAADYVRRYMERGGVEGAKRSDEV